MGVQPGGGADIALSRDSDHMTALGARTGSHTHIGKGEGLGYNINVPLNQVS